MRRSNGQKCVCITRVSLSSSLPVASTGGAVEQRATEAPNFLIPMKWSDNMASRRSIAQSVSDLNLKVPHGRGRRVKIGGAGDVYEVRIRSRMCQMVFATAVVHRMCRIIHVRFILGYGVAHGE